MDNQTFSGCIQQLEEHFNRKLKEPRFYWDELKSLPGDAFEQICKGRIRQYAPNPGNFPTIQNFMDDWQTWLKNNPHRKEIIHWEFCPYCEQDSPGLIVIRRPLETPQYRIPENNYRQSLARCGHCNNAQHRNPRWPRYRRDELEGKGWEVMTPVHAEQDDEDISIPRPTDKRAGMVTHIEKSLPTGDLDRDEDLPF